MSDVPAERTSSPDGMTRRPLVQYTFQVQGQYTWAVWAEDLIGALQLLGRLMTEQGMTPDGYPTGSPYSRTQEIRIHIWDPASAVSGSPASGYAPDER
jgi:hypothetical protein